MKKIVVVIAMLLLFSKIHAQLDSVFWFVAPEVSQYNRPNEFDRPIKLNIASFSNNPITVEISQPANNLFPVISRVISPNGDITVDLTAYISMIENDPPNQILSKGLYIKADGLVNIYYEIALGGVNPEIYPLKGRNALGLDFMIPGQNEYKNGDVYVPIPLNRIDIIATEDNTNITISPSKGINGNMMGTPFSITLGKGETYGIAALGRQPSDHLEGTIIKSTKPIAVTVSDDLLHHPNGGQDLIGDQIVPINVIGTEYIAIKGELVQGADKVYLLATENSTSIYLNGNATPIATINKGETYVLSYPGGSNAICFTSNKLIYAYQLTGMGHEFGAAILPAIKCTGSKHVKYKRGFGNTLKLNICVKAGGQGKFSVNGNQAIIQASDFSPVPGTNDTWFFTSKEISTSVASNGSLIAINCEENFHVGIFEGEAGGGCSYAFFSDYAVENAKILANPVNSMLCEGDSVLMYLENGMNYTDIEWTGPNGFTARGDSIWIKRVNTLHSGTYNAIAQSLICGEATASIDIIVNPLPEVNLGTDKRECGDILLDANAVYDSYLWSTGETTNQIKVSTTGNYWLEVKKNGCKNRDTVYADIAYRSVGNIHIDGSLCIGETIKLSTGIQGSNIVWSTGATTDVILVNTPGIYWVETEENGCKGRDTIDVKFVSMPVVNIKVDGNLCIGNSVELNAETVASDIVWNTGETTKQIVVNTSGEYWVTASEKGCEGKGTINIEFVSKPSISIRAEGNSCVDKEITLISETNVPNVIWNTGETTNQIKINKSGMYWASIDDGGCTNSDTINIEMGSPYAIIHQEGDVCDGEIILRVETNATDILWTTGKTSSQIRVNTSGVYGVDVRKGHCIGNDVTNVTIGKIDLKIGNYIRTNPKLLENKFYNYKLYSCKYSKTLYKMMKSIIKIDEETIRDENDKLILKRKITVNSKNDERVIYEDTIMAKTLYRENTPLNVFETWAINMFDTLRSKTE